MKKYWLMGIFALLVVSGAFAQLRLDLAIDVPVRIGVSVSDLSGGTTTESMGTLKFGTFPFPEGLLAYQTSVGPVNFGGGLRMFSVIIESVAWPHAYAELDLSPIVINAGIGGGVFMLFGLYNNIDAASLFIPDVHIAYKIGETFRLGVGAIGFAGSNLSTDAFPYMIYLTGRFSILFDKDK